MIIRRAIKAARSFLLKNPESEDFSKKSGLLIDLKIHTPSGHPYGLYWSLCCDADGKNMAIQVICGNPEDPHCAVFLTKPAESSDIDGKWIMISTCEWIKQAISTEVRFEMGISDSKVVDDPWSDTVEDNEKVVEEMGRVLDLE